VLLYEYEYNELWPGAIDGLCFRQQGNTLQYVPDGDGCPLVAPSVADYVGTFGYPIGDGDSGGAYNCARVFSGEPFLNVYADCDTAVTLTAFEYAEYWIPTEPDPDGPVDVDDPDAPCIPQDTDGGNGQPCNPGNGDGNGNGTGQPAEFNGVVQLDADQFQFLALEIAIGFVLILIALGVNGGFAARD
jgi:hypothetical protein